MVITHRPAAPQSEADPSAGGRAPRLPPPPAPARPGPPTPPPPPRRGSARLGGADGGRRPEARPPAPLARPSWPPEPPLRTPPYKGVAPRLGRHKSDCAPRLKGRRAEEGGGAAEAGVSAGGRGEGARRGAGSAHLGRRRTGRGLPERRPLRTPRGGRDAPSGLRSQSGRAWAGSTDTQGGSGRPSCGRARLPRARWRVRPREGAFAAARDAGGRIPQDWALHPTAERMRTALLCAELAVTPQMQFVSKGLHLFLKYTFKKF